MMRIILAICLLLTGFIAAHAQNEQAPILEKDIAYKDWTLKGIRDGKETNLRGLTKGKKLVAVVYWAPWCHNWQHDAPMLERLYEKYKEEGFGIVGVGEYGTVDAMKTSLDGFKITFPTVYESDSQAAYQTTPHYAYRTSTGDKRKWGSVYYVFLSPDKFAKDVDLLVSKTYIINGEMIERDGEQFIRQMLKLPAAETKLASQKTDGAEACDPNKPIALKKPVDKR
jgi:thiol-disulfide isomerase/thioredoxin